MIPQAGRFAPSPTGPLHMGSLLAATASWLDARVNGQTWMLRIDDIDTYRCVAGAESAILTTLEAHALHWDGPLGHQSDRLGIYFEALERLQQSGRVFYCTCSRRALKGSEIYPGTCREARHPRSDSAIRIRVDDADVRFDDRVMGPQREHLAKSCGDFIVRRRDGLIAYQLATAVDDGDGAITHVVRGGDLLEITARQIYLMGLLNLTVPSYAHIPTLLGPDGRKLSKQHHAPPLDDRTPAANLCTALEFLGLRPAAELKALRPVEVLDWGQANWDLTRVPSGSAVYRH